jgi:hypothetical protein
VYEHNDIEGGNGLNRFFSFFFFFEFSNKFLLYLHSSSLLALRYVSILLLIITTLQFCTNMSSSETINGLTNYDPLDDVRKVSNNDLAIYSRKIGIIHR